MSDDRGLRSTQQPEAKFGVRISRGIVTHLNDEPLLTWEQAEDAARKIEETTGERGDVERVYVLRALAALESVDE